MEECMKGRMTMEDVKELEKFISRIKTKPMDNGNYFLPDLLTVPFSETYKEALRARHNEEWIIGFEEYIKERNK